MIEPRRAHTADLDGDTSAADRVFLDGVFGNMTDDIFENVLGGAHALVFDDAALAAQPQAARGRPEAGRFQRPGQR